MYKELTLDEMYKGLLDDKVFVLKQSLLSDWRMFNAGTLRYFTPGGRNEIHLEMDDHDVYFGYKHVGSSAVTARKDGLEWIIKTIFKSEPSDFVELNYHTLLDVINEGR